MTEKPIIFIKTGSMVQEELEKLKAVAVVILINDIDAMRRVN